MVDLNINNNGVETTHCDYNAFVKRWLTIRDAIRGEVIIKDAGILYLPALRGQSPDEYDRYKRGAKWYSAPSLTVSGLTGMVARKPATIDVDEEVDKLLEDITLKGTSFDSFSIDILSDVITYGRAGVLVDYSDSKGLPYLCAYKPFDIINWLVEDEKLTLVVLRESYHKRNQTTPFSFSVTYRYRVLSLEENFYTITVYEEVENGPTEIVEVITPTIKGRKLDYIPFYLFTSGSYCDFGTEIADPPIEPITNLALHYYLVSADYHWGLHWIALPTPWVTGVTQETVPDTLGPHQVWGLPDGSSCGMLEYTGAGLGELREAQETDKREMADSGARLLETRSKTGEAARTVDLKQTSDSSVLAGIVTKVSTGMEQALRWYVAWLGKDSTDVTCQLNMDFIPEDIDPQLLTALIAALQANEISRAEFFQQLQRGEIISGDKTFEEHEEELETDAANRAIVLRATQDELGMNDETNNQ